MIESAIPEKSYFVQLRVLLNTAHISLFTKCVFVCVCVYPTLADDFVIIVFEGVKFKQSHIQKGFIRLQIHIFVFGDAMQDPPPLYVPVSWQIVLFRTELRNRSVFAGRTLSDPIGLIQQGRNVEM